MQTKNTKFGNSLIAELFFWLKLKTDLDLYFDWESGWFKNEPLKVILDKPELIFKAKAIYENELGYSKHEFEHAFALPNYFLEQLMP